MTLDEVHISLCPRLIDVKELMRSTGLGRDACLKLLHRAGPVRVGRRLLARPADIERVFEQLRVEVGE